MNNVEIRELSTEELKGAITSTEVRLKKLKFAHAVSQIENPSLIKSTRKQIARLKTELTARVISEVKEKAKGKRLETDEEIVSFLKENTFVLPVGKKQLKRILSKQ